MKTIGDGLGSFQVTGVKPGFNESREHGQSAFEDITQQSFPGKWKVIYFYPKDFTLICPTEIVAFAHLVKAFADHDAVVLGCSTDSEFCKLAWRREHPQLHHLNHHSLSDIRGSLVDSLGVRDPRTGAAMRATFIVDPDNVIQHVSVNASGVGRNPEEVLRILDALQTGELCPAQRPLGGETLS